MEVKLIIILQTNHVSYDNGLIIQGQPAEPMQNGHKPGTLTTNIQIHC